MILRAKDTVFAFDLDDTLYNEIDYLKSAYKYISIKLASRNNWKELYAKTISLYRKQQDVFEYLSTTYNCDKQDLIKDYRYHFPNIQPFDHLVDLLKNIKKNGGKIAIITDGREITQNNKIESLKIKEYLDIVIISEIIGTEKPSKPNYLQIESTFPNHDYIYIADNYKKDFITPNRRKWTTIGLIDNGLNVHNNCFDYCSKKNYSPLHLINKFNEIEIT